MPSPLPPHVVRACVIAGDVDTHYYGMGRGDPVLILVGDIAMLSVLLARFPRHLRAIAPDPHRRDVASGLSPTDFGAWLRGFLDALGVQRVAMVADPAFASLALAFARAEPDRVTRLVVARTGGDGEARARGEIADRQLSDAPPPTLSIDVADEQTIDCAMLRIVDFMSCRGATDQ